ncbi:MAG: alkane 1-monooxygenase [Bacteroidota bacterium]
MKDLKYILAYTIPCSAFLAIYLQGAWSYSTIIYAFVIVPVLEVFLPQPTENLAAEERAEKLKSKFFDYLLYLNLPIIGILLVYYFQTIATTLLTTAEITGLTLSMGTMLGACGINVAHELGHRADKGEQLLAKILLLPELYMHFFIEHNRGHHKNIATDLDPASAKYGEPLQLFWLRSVFGGYRNAWILEAQRLQRKGRSILSWQNEMLRFQAIQLAYLVSIGLIWNWRVMGFAVLVAVIAFLLLETINYIEHYGLRRKKLASGRYEKVNVQHSWNSNHEFGRIILYELTRHSDHHFKSNKKYQILDHHNTSPQLPLGYPTSMLMALVPPLWFAVMDREVKQYKARLEVG